jgi:DNA repair protein RecO (recombination protein O)
VTAGGATDAVFLRIVDYKERHRIATLYTRQWGRVSAVARRSRSNSKRFSGHIDLFHRGEAVLVRSRRGGGLSTLGSFLVRQGHDHLRTDLVRFAIASFWAELVLSTTAEGNASTHQYDVLTDMLDRLNGSSQGRRFDLILGFQLRWFSAMGVLPPLDEESLAAAKLPMLDDQAMAVARALVAGVDISDLDAQVFGVVGRLTRQVRHQLVSREFASTKFLMEMLG